ncbi:MAG: enoyl-CoA hydratase/isomerase family protein, partial [Pseudomonadota bacterium]
MSESHLLYEKDGAVARITINREERRNALSPEAMSLFLQHLDTAEADDEVRVVLVTAKGQRAFCAGADLSSGMGSGSAEG